MNPNHLLLQEMYVIITILEWLVSTWHKQLTENPEERHLELSDYLNKIWGALVTLSALQWTPVAKATHLQELAGCFRLRLSPDAHIGHLQKNECCIQILDITLPIYEDFCKMQNHLSNIAYKGLLISRNQISCPKNQDV